jgi:LSM domain
VQISTKKLAAEDDPDAEAMADAAAAAPATKTPADFLKSIKGRRVLVKLNSGVDYRGILACLDGYMNIAMEQTEVRAMT